MAELEELSNISGLFSVNSESATSERDSADSGVWAECSSRLEVAVGASGSSPLGAGERALGSEALSATIPGRVSDWLCEACCETAEAVRVSAMSVNNDIMATNRGSHRTPFAKRLFCSVEVTAGGSAASDLRKFGGTLKLKDTPSLHATQSVALSRTFRIREG